MGQYYTVYLKNKEKEILLSPLDYDNGLKLMEHSYIGNNFMNVVATLLKKPSIIAWVGDYAESNLNNNKDLENDMCEHIINSSNQNQRIFEKNIKSEVSMTEGYLINLTKKVFLNLGKYVNTISNDWCVNPLSLLTAIGNGQGGGDYRGKNIDSVGIWAGDELVYTKLLSEKLKEEKFKEFQIEFEEF